MVRPCISSCPRWTPDRSSPRRPSQCARTTPKRRSRRACSPPSTASIRSRSGFSRKDACDWTATGAVMWTARQPPTKHCSCRLLYSFVAGPPPRNIVSINKAIKNPRGNRGLRDTHPSAVEAAVAALRDLQVFRRGLAAIGDEFVLDHLPLIQGAQPGPLNSRDVDEHVLIACRRTDESVAFRWIEPFDGALLHRLSPGKSERLVNTRVRSLRSA